MNDHPTPWPVIDSEIEYKTGWYTGGYDLVEQPDGTTKRYYWAELRPAVVIVASVDERVLFVEQYRPTIREHQLELPAGIVEPGESATEAAGRELREETSFAANSLAIIEEMWVATGVLRHRRSVVFADGLEPVEAEPDESEFLRVKPVPVDQALKRAREPPSNDSTIESLLLANEDGLLPLR